MMMAIDEGGGRVRYEKIDLPSNSHKSKQESPKKPKVEQVTTARVVKRKKPLLTRVRNRLIVDDMQTVGFYILEEVVVPAVKDLLLDIVTGGSERALFGGGRRSSRGTGIPSNYTPYNKVSSIPARKAEVRQVSPTARANHDFGEIIFASRGEAEKVKDGLARLLDTYDVATLADFYDLAGVTSSFVDNKWGWFDIRDAKIMRMTASSGGGYVIDLPPPEEI